MLHAVLRLTSLVGLLLLVGPSAGAEKTLAEGKAAKLGKDVVALFEDRCISCHGTDKPKARLSLVSLEALGRGGKDGPVVEPGKLDQSLLWQLVEENKMPPKKPLKEAERQVLRRWIEAKAPGLPAYRPQAPAHWAFRPLVPPALPTLRAGGVEPRNDIDRFILSALEKKNLALSPEADRLTLARRVAFDLVGLPPAPEEIDAFLADQRPDAYERMVDRYLSSPHYGERWGKYWLDAAGYADSNGYFNADSERPLAYRYRDYVIRSFNADKPYDRFVREQLAGDELAGYVPDGDVTPDMIDGLVATHFLRNAPDGSGESDGNPDEVRIDRYTVIEGNLQNAMSALLGITIQCARCHSHKFEPITHRDYYSLQAILFPAYNPDRWLAPKDRIIAVGTAAERETHRRRSEPIEHQIKALQTSLETLGAPFIEQLASENLQKVDKAEHDGVLKALRVPKDKRNAEQNNLLKKYPDVLTLTDEDAAKRFPEFAALRRQLRETIAAREKERPAQLEKLSVFVETDPKPPVHHILLRGVHDAQGPEVRPGVPAALCGSGNDYQVALSNPSPPTPLPKRARGEISPISSGRRTAFANWVTSPQNPLFARVMVNRIWQHHFGAGIVATPDNLGQSGAKPSHPELLDYLAAEFIRTGWSVKSIHRLILNSNTYRQVSTWGAEREAQSANTALRASRSALHAAADPDNRLLWHFPLRRLDAEVLRDTLLSVSGELDRRSGGAYVPTTRAGDGDVLVDEKHEGAKRRSVYLQQRRTQVLTLLELFDAPAIISNCSFRNTSTVPLQSLALLNSEFARLRAAAFARRLDLEAGRASEQRLQWAAKLAYSRPLGGEETEAAKRFLAEQKLLYSSQKDGEQRAWTDLCQMILASNAFLYVE